MSFLQDKINSIMAYFDTDDVPDEGQDTLQKYEEAPAPPKQEAVRQKTIKEESVPTMTPTPETHSINRVRTSPVSGETTTIDIKFPKKYEEAREIVNLLLQDVSVLIDFQHMTDSQARRCIDYLDGARFVLNGNLKKISSTMWLLTPVNVVVNIEDMGLRGEAQDSSFDFDMKRR